MQSNYIDKFRQLMAERHIDAAIIPKTDPHQSEYVAAHWEFLQFLSGFTGSAGTLVITADSACLWTDSRYFIQAARQLDGSGITLMRDGLSSTPSIEEFLIHTLDEGDTVGVDGMLFSVNKVEEMQDNFAVHGIKLDSDFDVADIIWPDRPSLPKDKVFIHSEEYSGESARSKIAAIIKEIRSMNAMSALITPLDEIAWTLNIRCRDVQYNPVAMSYLYIDPAKTLLFIDPDKLSDETEAYLRSQGVEILSYNDIRRFLSSLPADVKVLVEKARLSSSLAAILGDKAMDCHSLVAVPKACKNTTQIRGIRNAMLRDGVALVKAFKEFEERMANGQQLSELDMSALLLKYRSEQPLFFDESFATISAYGPNGAIVHYEPDERSNAAVHTKGLLLVDSGAQYLDGTTDITRTICLGEPTKMEMHDFTLVMKGHIALATMVFPQGTYGVQLDAEARKFLWREGLTYLHGTGHGVGHFLNVHEGPQQIRMNHIPAVLREGMVTSNEPGLYRENIHGIRCENLVLCVKAMTTEFGEFLKFETLTLFPFDLRLFETEIMSEEEINWVNDYHANVRHLLSPYLTEEERKWLASKTTPLIRK